ncbi:alpha-hydroxy acid oxidase [Arthrobacter globiformis]|uniref:alpha-hydroxy acid oxidase n=1 Tax=Arthrobacter globiformis TaxID=1665 RepID=UPI00279068F3|nr:alpha-hydroxy acid oxidase [Arthrobacter globiformis]MDQ0618432.1 isopentenyl diphosphate isomerase/L-lactate dehydrogenase-like FMN-dependent dehydrogenase [Arthrobacter globiformis]
MEIAGFRLSLTTRPRPLTIEDWRQRARRRLPDMMWNFIENGADDERTLRDNTAAFDAWALRQRVLRGGGNVDLSTTVAGETLDLPILFAPIGLCGAAHWHGELGAARAAEQMGTRSVLSSASTYSIEEVAEGTSISHWFQLYPWGDRELSRSMMERAKSAGYKTLVVTVDMAAVGNRLGEKRYGMGLPPTLSPARILSAALRPSWCWAYLVHGRTTMKNLNPTGGGAVKSAATQQRVLAAPMNWADLKWMRDVWDGPLLVKGILDPDDAERCVDLGAQGVIVSNHGGRQLGGAQATLEALPAIADRIGDRADVLFDGGIRSGRDVVVALALGAKACLVGRPLTYGLAGGGTAGARDVLRILSDELTRNLKLMGVESVRNLERSALLPRASGTLLEVGDGLAHGELQVAP